MEVIESRSGQDAPPVLHVKGEIDLATAAELRASLEEALAADPSVVVDMTGVTFIDAAGLRVILQAAEGMNGQAPLTLTNASCVAKLLRLVGLEDLRWIELRESD